MQTKKVIWICLSLLCLMGLCFSFNVYRAFVPKPVDLFSENQLIRMICNALPPLEFDQNISRDHIRRVSSHGGVVAPAGTFYVLSCEMDEEYLRRFTEHHADLILVSLTDLRNQREPAYYINDTYLKYVQHNDKMTVTAYIEASSTSGWRGVWVDIFKN